VHRTCANPDRGLDLRKDVCERLRHSFAVEARGERGIPAEELAKRLGIEDKPAQKAKCTFSNCIRSSNF
jgi:hypothetical protein